MPRRAAAALADVRVRHATIFVLFVGLTFLWFHRLVFHLGDAVLVGPNDESYSIRQYWAAQHFGKTPFTFHRDPLNGAPEGLPTSTAVQVANFIIPGTIWGLHYLVGLTAAENLFLLGGFVLSGFAFYLLLDRLGFHPLASIYASYALMFNPWMIERAYAGHHGFMQAWVFPVLVAALLYQHERRTAVSAILVGLAVAVAFYASSYYGLLATLVIVVFWIVDLVRRPTWQERLWTFSLADIAVVAGAIAFLPALVAWRSDSHDVSSQVSNGVSQLQSLGASAQSYILPSVRNPVLGHITRHFDPFADQHWAENTLYLGWSLLALALVAAVLILRRRSMTVASPLRRYFLISMLVLAPAAFVCSLKRETSILGLNVPMPAYFIGDITTFWRVFARFGVLALFACATLAAFTLTVAIRRFRHGYLLAVVASAALVFEFYAGVAPIYSFAKPAPYAVWLARQPKGIVANYPLPTDQPAALTLLATTFYEQMVSKQPQFALFGSGYGGTREDAIRILVRYVTDPATPSVLKAEGVRYVLLHDDVYRQEGQSPPPVPAGFHLVARIPGDVRALEINRGVQPADIPSVLEQNAIAIGLAQGLETPRFQAAALSSQGAGTLDGPTTVELSWSDNRLRRCQLIVHASSTSPQSLQIVDEGGTVVAQGSVGRSDTQLILGPFSLHGTSERFQLRPTSSDPMQIASLAVQPVADFSVSIRD